LVNLNRRNPFVDIGVDGSVILKVGYESGMDFSDSGYTAGVIILKIAMQLRVTWKTGHSLATE
jgi:hypothetical protein